MPTRKITTGFTLIELSIVLVIIGLLVGGIMVGNDLMNASKVRAQISQIEKYNTAIHSFRLKFGYLPGDIPEPTASSFGFQTRGQYAGEGDGNNILEGVIADSAGQNCPTCNAAGETVMLWEDLSFANLIDGAFSAASPTTPVAVPMILTESTTPPVNKYFPRAKFDGKSYVYIWSRNGVNYFCIAAIDSLYNTSGYVHSSTSMTVQMAYSIDSKIDDGLPRLGRIKAELVFQNNILGAAGGGHNGASTNAATPPLNYTCYDNNNVSNATQKYSLAQNGGSGINCALTMRFE